MAEYRRRTPRPLSVPSIAGPVSPLQGGPSVRVLVLPLPGQGTDRTGRIPARAADYPDRVQSNGLGWETAALGLIWGYCRGRESADKSGIEGDTARLRPSGAGMPANLGGTNDRTALSLVGGRTIAAVVDADGVDVVKPAAGECRTGNREYPQPRHQPSSRGRRRIRRRGGSVESKPATTKSNTPTSRPLPSPSATARAAVSAGPVREPVQMPVRAPSPATPAF